MSLKYPSKTDIITPKSLNSSNHSHHKNHPLINPQSTQFIHQSLLTPSKHSKRTNSQFNFQTHDPQFCVCQACDCGKHKCKLQCPKPQIRCSTTYSNSYRKTKNNFNQQQNIQFTPKKNIQKTVDLTTTYQQKFASKSINVQKPIKHQDNQKFSGPSVQLTTYKQKYPGYNGKNPYVKKKPDQYIGGLEFKGQTMYGSQFFNRKIQVSKPIKHSDNLRTSSCWFGKSSYKEDFQTKNPQNYKLLNYKPKNRYEKRPASAYQYQSSYKRVYENPSVQEPCPAQNLLSKLTQSISKYENLVDSRSKIAY